MKKLILSLVASLALVGGAQASGGSVHLDKAPVDVSDIASLQRGAKLFVNYCLNCHSASAMRYNRLRDIGLTDAQIKDKLTFTTEKIGDTMKAAIDPKQAKDWFGATPPDLSVIARAKASGDGSGADYLYTYLRSFYRDETRPTGWNNVVFPNVGMPHVLWQLNGQAELKEEVFENEHAAHAALVATRGVAQLEEMHQMKDGVLHERYVLKTIVPGKGSLSSLEYDKAIADLANYMNYMAEPARLERRTIGFYVLMVLGLLLVLVYALKKSYWKDLH